MSFIEDINFNASQIQILIDKSKPLQDFCQTQIPDFIYCAAIGSILHSYYNGLEKIFLLVNKEIDKTIISGDRSHKILFETMSMSTEKRKAFISEQTKENLREYLGFRHFFRHAYVENLNWEHLKPLFLGLNTSWSLAKNDIELFIRNIRASL